MMKLFGRDESGVGTWKLGTSRHPIGDMLPMPDAGYSISQTITASLNHRGAHIASIKYLIESEAKGFSAF
jgi:hypothetical protein